MGEVIDFKDIKKEYDSLGLHLDNLNSSKNNKNGELISFSYLKIQYETSNKIKGSS